VHAIASDEKGNRKNNSQINEHNCTSKFEYLIVSRGARIALDIAPAKAPLANSLTSLVLKNACGE
jgi:hypothetical protein